MSVDRVCTRLMRRTQPGRGWHWGIGRSSERPRIDHSERIHQVIAHGLIRCLPKTAEEFRQVTRILWWSTTGRGLILTVSNLVAHRRAAFPQCLNGRAENIAQPSRGPDECPPDPPFDGKSLTLFGFGVCRRTRIPALEQ